MHCRLTATAQSHDNTLPTTHHPPPDNAHLKAVVAACANHYPIPRCRDLAARTMILLFTRMELHMTCLFVVGDEVAVKSWMLFNGRVWRGWLSTGGHVTRPTQDYCLSGGTLIL
jgi:hypothetical protein